MHLSDNSSGMVNGHGTTKMWGSGNNVDISLYAFAFYLIIQILSSISIQNAILLGHIRRQAMILQTCTMPTTIRGRKPRHPNSKSSRQNFHLMMQADELNFRENFKVSCAAFIAIVLAIKATGFHTRSPTGSTHGMHKCRIRCSVALAIFNVNSYVPF